MKITEQTLKELEMLGALVEVSEEGLVLIGDWHDKFKPYHELFVEIKGALYKPFFESHIPFDKDLLPNLKRLGWLFTDGVAQHPDFLMNLEELGELYTEYVVQHPDFLRNLKKIGWVYTFYATQHPDFLRNAIKTNIYGNTSNSRAARAATGRRASE